MLAFWAGWHRRELSELLDRLNPRDVRLSCITGTPMPHATSASSCRGCHRSFQWQISVSHLLQRHRATLLSLEQTLGSKNIRVGVALGGDPIFLFVPPEGVVWDPFWGQATAA